jgi:Tfp pilus assembly protein PilN
VIQVNLLPGGKKGRSKSFSFSMPSFGGGGGGVGMPDPYQAFTVAAGIVAIGYMAWAFLGVRAAAEEMEVELAAAVQDSLRYADQILLTNTLMARRDSIAQRVEIIQEIDAGRYIWPHVMDEVARAVPDYTWLRSVIYTGDSPLQLRLEGRAGSLEAITTYMDQLEASRFLRAVKPERMEQAPSETNPDDLIYEFELIAEYMSPSLDELQTVPLFQEGVVAQEAVPDTTGGS